MKSRTTQRFRSCFGQLPRDIQQRAREVYFRFRANPLHPSLRFKRVHDVQPIYSVRISLEYRALGLRDGEDMIWFWIGHHDEYERLLGSK